MFKRIKIGTKSTIYSLFFALILATALYFIIFNLYTSSYLKSFESAAREVATGELDKLQLAFNHHINNLRIYSDLKDLGEVAAANQILIENFLSEEAEPTSDFLFDRDLQWLSTSRFNKPDWAKNINTNSTSQALREFVSSFNEKYHYQAIGEIFITDKNGVNVAQSDWTSDYYQADEFWWRSCKENNFYIGRVYHDESADTRAIEVAFPLFADNEFSGVLKAIVNTKLFTDILDSDFADSQDGVFAEQAYMLFKKDGEPVYSSEKNNFLHGLDLSQVAKVGSRYLEQTNNNRIFVSSLSGQNGNLADPGLFLMLGYDKDMVLQRLRVLKYSIMLVVFWLVILLAIISSLVFYRLLGPLRDFHRLTDSIKGVPLKPIRVEDGAEIGSLITVFNRLIRKLKQCREETEDKIKSRTAELEKLNKHLLGRELKMIELKKKLNKLEQDED